MFKKTTALAMALCMAVSASAMAAEITNSDYADGTYTVSGNGADANMPVKIEIFKNGKGYDDAANVTASNIADTYLYMDQIYADEDGEFEFSVPVPAANKNGYVKISFFDGSVEKTQFVTYDEAALNAAVAAFVANENRTVTDLKTLIMDYYIGLDVDIDTFNGMTDDEEATLLANALDDVMADYDPETDTPDDAEDISRYINNAILIELLSNGTDLDTVNAYEEYAAFTGENYYADYALLSDEEKTAVIASAEGAADEAAVMAALENGTIIETIKNCIWSGVEAKLKFYEDNIGLDLTPVKAVSDSKQKKVYEKFLKKVQDGDITEISQFNSELATLASSSSNSGNDNIFTPGPSSDKGNTFTGSVPGIVLPTVTQTNFDDIANYAWAADAINKLYDKGVVNGKADKVFDPAGNVTREEFTSMIVRAMGYKSNGATADFNDVANGHWSYDAVLAAKANGIIAGDDFGNFMPKANITRQDIAVIAYRVITKAGLTVNGNTSIEFKDAKSVADYAEDAVSALASANILNGSEGMFRPTDYANRAEAAVIIQRILDYCNVK